jgi:hypothetical protein
MSNDDTELLNHVRTLRKFTPENQLEAVQLTQDQKPEDPDETERIVRYGGEVD